MKVSLGTGNGEFGNAKKIVNEDEIFFFWNY